MNLPRRLAAVVFLLLPVLSTAAALAAFAPQSQDTKSQHITIGKGDKLADVLPYLLQLTDSQVYLVGPLDMQARVDSMTGRPGEVLKIVLQNYSYVATRTAAGSAPGVTVLSLSEPMESMAETDSAAAEAQGRRSDDGAVVLNGVAVKKSSHQSGRREPVPQTRQRVVGGNSTASAPLEQESSDRGYQDEASGPAPDAESAAETSATAAEKAAEKQRLEAKIVAVDKYIKSGKAEKDYLYWANIKDPKYIYDPWQELAQLKTRYSQL